MVAVARWLPWIYFHPVYRATLSPLDSGPVRVDVNLCLAATRGRNAAGNNVGSAASPYQTPRENLAGLVERTSFHTAEGGLRVLRLKARG